MTEHQPTEDPSGNPDATDNERRPVVNDQEPTGEQGISSDKPGVDPGGYPGPDDLSHTEETASPGDDATSEEDDA